MYIYKELMADDSCKGRVSSIIHKIRRNAGLVDIYMICLAKNRDTFEIIDCMNLKQKAYPKDELYILGFARGKDSAIQLSAQLFLKLSDRYGIQQFKKELFEHVDTLFRRY